MADRINGRLINAVNVSDIQRQINELNETAEHLESDKQDKLISGETIKEINGTTLLGSGNIQFKTINGISLTSAGEIRIKKLNGVDLIGNSDVVLKTVDGEDLIGPGNIPAVRLDTEQEITGIKTFDDGIILKSADNLYNYRTYKLQARYDQDGGHDGLYLLADQGDGQGFAYDAQFDAGRITARDSYLETLRCGHLGDEDGQYHIGIYNGSMPDKVTFNTMRFNPDIGYVKSNFGLQFPNTINYTADRTIATLNDIAVETERAITAEGQLNTNLRAERDRAIEAETQLNNDLSAEIEHVAEELDEAIEAETTARENADSDLQQQIDAIESRSDVVDVVATKAALDNYDTSTLSDNDVIKVLADETRGDATTYYRWVITSGVGAWIFVGAIGPYVTLHGEQTIDGAKTFINSTGIKIQSTSDGLPSRFIGSGYNAQISYDGTNGPFSLTIGQEGNVGSVTVGVGAGANGQAYISKRAGTVSATSGSAFVLVPNVGTSSSPKTLATTSDVNTLTWTDGTTAGPTATITAPDGTTTSSISAIPSASTTISGIVTTGDQTFAGNKTFAGTSTIFNGTVHISGKDFGAPSYIYINPTEPGNTSVPVMYISRPSDGSISFENSGGTVPAGAGGTTFKFTLAGNSDDPSTVNVKLPHKDGILAIDSELVHKTGNLSEDITGEKTFKSKQTIDVSSFNNYLFTIKGHSDYEGGQIQVGAIADFKVYPSLQEGNLILHTAHLGSNGVIESGSESYFKFPGGKGTSNTPAVIATTDDFSATTTYSQEKVTLNGTNLTVVTRDTVQEITSHKYLSGGITLSTIGASPDNTSLIATPSYININAAKGFTFGLQSGYWALPVNVLQKEFTPGDDSTKGQLVELKDCAGIKITSSVGGSGHAPYTGDPVIILGDTMITETQLQKLLALLETLEAKDIQEE